MSVSLPFFHPLPPSRGFCYFNSVAIAAKQLQQKLSANKILIVDWVRDYSFSDCSNNSSNTIFVGGILVSVDLLLF